MSKSLVAIARHPFRAAVILALALLALVVGLMNASAVHDLDLFEMDRNIADDLGNEPDDDWLTPPNHAVNGGAFEYTGVLPDPAGTTIFWTGGSKDDLDVPNWRHTSGSVPDKDELTRAGAAAYLDSGDLIVYYFADRFSNNGDSTFGLWLFQEEVTLNGDGTRFNGQHQVGDVLIRGNFTASGVLQELIASEWVGDGSGNEGNGNIKRIGPAGVDCVGAASGDDFCATTNLTCTAAFAGYVPKAKNGCAAGQYPPVSFQEGGINISDALNLTDIPCFNSFMVMSRSSTSVRAQLKDFVLGSFPTCGGVKVIKDTVPNDPQDFRYDSNITTGTCTVDTTPDVFFLDDDGDPAVDKSNTEECEEVSQGTYLIRETTVAGFTLTDIDCTGDAAIGTNVFIGTSAANLTGFNVNTTNDFDAGDNTVQIVLAPSDNITCTFTNTKLGKITIIKDAVPDAPADFTFVDTIPAPCVIGPLDDDADPTLPDRTVCNNVAPGTYTVEETPIPTGWDLTNIVCTVDVAGAGSSFQLGNGALHNPPFVAGDDKVSISLGAGGEVTCTFTNTKRARIIINKVTNPSPDLSATSFPFATTGSGYAAFSLLNGGQNDTGFTLVPGNYSAREFPIPAGWTLTDIACVVNVAGAGAGTSVTITGATVSPTNGFEAGDDKVNATLAPGGQITCTFTNTSLFKLIVITCDTTSETLVDSTVSATVSGAPVTIESIRAADLPGITQAQACGMGSPSRQIDNMPQGNYNVGVELPDLPPTFP